MGQKLTDSRAAANLYLVGFMGTGKSAVGRRLAASLRYDFIDSDEWIEQETGLSIPEIFAEHGEEGFREWERKFIEGGHPNRGCVVSCGGGLIVPDGMLERVQSSGMVFCLFATPKTILERTQKQTNRPLLKTDKPEERIRALLKEREPVYMKAGTLVTTDCRTPAEIAAHIERAYREERQHGRSAEHLNPSPR